jgi:ankyrin repeat protein
MTVDDLGKLLMAARYEDLERALAADATHINDLDSTKQTLLERAIAWKHPRAVEILLRDGADPNRVDDQGRTPLAGAVSHDDEHSVQLLLRHGADHSIADAHGNAPLWAAVIRHRGGPGPIIRALLAAGADKHHVNRHGRSPAQLAASINSPELHAIFA